jgi:hypothetical protein
MKVDDLMDEFTDLEEYKLKHAIRVNGIVDIWNNGKTFFCIPKKEYVNIKGKENQIEYVRSCLLKYGKEQPMKKLKGSGRMSYKEFINNMRQDDAAFKLSDKPKRKSKQIVEEEELSSEHKQRYYEYLASDHWKLVRDGLFYRRGKQCERCGSVSDIQVHHKTYDNVFSEVGDDLEILCGTCHKKEHGIGQEVVKPKTNSNKQTLSDDEYNELYPDGAPFR